MISKPEQGKKVTIQQILLLQFAVMVYSTAGVFNKYAAIQPFLSVKYILFYGVSIGILFLYAIIWQQILRKVELSTAYSNKPISMIWSILWGILLFHETVTWNMLVGSAVILIGVYVVVTSNE